MKNKHIKITNLPRDINPEELFEERCFQEYGQCPFCGCAKRGRPRDSSNPFSSRTGVDSELKYVDAIITIKFIYQYCCNECGAEWESPRFSTKYLDTKYYLKKGKLQ